MRQRSRRWWCPAAPSRQVAFAGDYPSRPNAGAGGRREESGAPPAMPGSLSPRHRMAGGAALCFPRRGNGEDVGRGDASGSWGRCCHGSREYWESPSAAWAFRESGSAAPSRERERAALTQLRRFREEAVRESEGRRCRGSRLAEGEGLRVVPWRRRRAGRSFAGLRGGRGGRGRGGARWGAGALRRDLD